MDGRPVRALWLRENDGDAREHVQIEAPYQPQALDPRQKLAWPDNAPVTLPPANQRFERDHLTRRNVDDGLEERQQFVVAFERVT